MKARSGRLGDFVMTLLLLLIGAGLIYGSLVNTAVGQRIADALQRPIVGAGLGVILILSVVLRWVGGCGKKKDTFINFHSEDGSVGISTKAICDFIERIGKEFSAIKSIDSTLNKGKDSVDIALSVKVVAGNKIPELSHVLQQRVRESVRESLGLEEIGNITIKVQEIVGDPAKPAPEEIPVAE
ncbi:MAG: hypothetical protein KAU94_00305 [Verrucomicrobia bacterium]|nr:hypothetical protein [Verrucomicrobiota bacterium]